MAKQMTFSLTDLGLRPLINATGPWTRVGNSTLSPSVLAAMGEAAQAYLPVADLQVVASRVIFEATGAEAGYATPGASAGITLAVAACIAGEDPDRIKSLPHIDGPPDHVVMFQQHRGYYDFAVRATGARLRLIDAAEADALDRLSAAIDHSVACVFYDCTGLPYKDQSGVPDLAAVISVAHGCGVRVVVDASLSVPPPENLRTYIELGADAVAFTASKAMQGPAASGFVACRAELARSMALQHQDIDVLAAITGKGDPNNLFMGLGRGLKVGKEQVAGMLVALQEYLRRDHVADQRSWRRALETIDQAVSGLNGISRRWLNSNEGRAPYLSIGFERALGHLEAQAVSDALLDGEPSIFIAAHHGNSLSVGAETLRDGEAEIVGRRLAETIAAMTRL